MINHRPTPNFSPQHSYRRHLAILLFFFNDTATTEIYTLSLHDALPIFRHRKIRSTRVARASYHGATVLRPNDRWRDHYPMVKAAIAPSSGRTLTPAGRRTPSLLDLWLAAFGKQQRHAVKRLNNAFREKSIWPKASNEAIVNQRNPRKKRSG